MTDGRNGLPEGAWAATRSSLALDRACAEGDRAWFLAECEALDQFRRQSLNLYERARALFFLFFLGMDYPEGARVVNISVDLSVWTDGGDGGDPGANARGRRR